MKVSAAVIFMIIPLMAYSQTKKILFVCEHGSAKSVIAATYFNKLAKEKNIPWEAVSRGTTPDSIVSFKTRQLLEKENLFDPVLRPELLTQEDVAEAEVAFLFYPLPASIRESNNLNYWLEINAVNNDYQKLRDDIVAKIIPLIDSLSKQ
jgi:arsenate reductase (thioredoxin)